MCHVSAKGRAWCSTWFSFSMFEPNIEFKAGGAEPFQAEEETLPMSRQWQGRRDQRDDDEEGEQDTSFSGSGSGSAGRTSRSGDGKKGSISPPPAYNESREAEPLRSSGFGQSFGFSPPMLRAVQGALG